VLKAVFDAFLDLKVRSERLIVDGNQVAQILSIEGTDLGGFLGLPPTGKIFQLPAVFLYELNGLTIVRERRIYDFTGMLVQIGALKAKPT
jgi:predicted ester cyclase